MLVCTMCRARSDRLLAVSDFVYAINGRRTAGGSLSSSLNRSPAAPMYVFTVLRRDRQHDLEASEDEEELEMHINKGSALDPAGQQEKTASLPATSAAAEAVTPDVHHALPDVASLDAEVHAEEPSLLLLAAPALPSSPWRAVVVGNAPISATNGDSSSHHALQNAARRAVSCLQQDMTSTAVPTATTPTHPPLKTGLPRKAALQKHQPLHPSARTWSDIGPPPSPLPSGCIEAQEGMEVVDMHYDGGTGIWSDVPQHALHVETEAEVRVVRF